MDGCEGTGHRSADAGSADGLVSVDCRDEASDEGLARAERCNKGYSATARTVLTLRESDGKGGHSVDTLDGRERVWVERGLLIRQGGDKRLAAAVFHPFNAEFFNPI